MLKMEVKQKARELIEKQIKDQKLLLTKFENAKTVEEKTQILELVKKLSQSIEKEREILNNKNFETPSSPSLFANTSPFTFQKVPTQKNIIINPSSTPTSSSISITLIRCAHIHHHQQSRRRPGRNPHSTF